jgi:uncharacterized membrane protein
MATGIQCRSTGRERGSRYGPPMAVRSVVPTSGLATAARWLLAVFLLAAGAAHFLAPEEFLAQVPPWLPARLAIVYVSGVVELTLGGALLVVRRHRVLVGWIVAAFFVAVLPGNISQAVTGTPAFGLETDAARWSRLAFQPLLVLWALWSTGAWRAWRSRSA